MFRKASKHSTTSVEEASSEGSSIYETISFAQTSNHLLSENHTKLECEEAPHFLDAGSISTVRSKTQVCNQATCNEYELGYLAKCLFLI